MCEALHVLIVGLMTAGIAYLHRLRQEIEELRK